MADAVFTNSGLLSVIAEFTSTGALDLVSQAVKVANRPILKHRLTQEATEKYMNSGMFRERLNRRVERPWTQLSFTLNVGRAPSRWPRNALLLSATTSLDLFYTKDFSPLTSFRNLRTLSVRSENTYSVRFGRPRISHLPLLESLAIEGLPEGLQGISDLPKLTSLTLKVPSFGVSFLVSGSERLNLGPLAAFSNLQVFRAPGFQFRSLQPLAALAQLRELDLSNQNETPRGSAFYSPLAELKNLEVLHLAAEAPLRGGEHPRLGFLPNLKKLKDLDLCGFAEDWSVLAELPQLEKLRLSDSVDVAYLAQIPRLKDLSVQGVKMIKNLPLLNAIPFLHTLDVAKTNFADLAHIAGLRNLSRLFCSRSQLQDLSSFAVGFANIRELWIGGSNVSDITALANAKNLAVLDLMHSEVADLGPLGGLLRLEKLNISGLRLLTLESLLTVTSLRMLAIKNLVLTDDSALKTLQTRGVQTDWLVWLEEVGTL